jgi:site-specific DNA-methyltransferase (adenine-specific)
MKVVDVRCGSNLDLLPLMPDNSIDAVVTDPPYEIGFLGRAWDSTGIAYSVPLWREVLRVLKPGGHLAAFGATRSYHRMAVAIEDAGFEIRDCMMWMYGSGFPKSLDISKAIDKAAGVDRKVVGQYNGAANYGTPSGFAVGGKGQTVVQVTEPATEDAKRWDGWGTALKPAVEPVVLARKPLRSTVVENVLTWGTGGINIDGCRIGDDEMGVTKSDGVVRSSNMAMGGGNTGRIQAGTKTGRWPANVLLDEEAAAVLDADSGLSSSKSGGTAGWQDSYVGGTYSPIPRTGYDDKGGASRFFYTAKAPVWEREAGLDEMPRKQAADALPLVKTGAHARAGARNEGRANIHPTVKPIDLMRYLCRLLCPPDGTVLDPFAGSGSTGVGAVLEGFGFIGLELDPVHVEIATSRIEAALQRRIIVQHGKVKDAKVSPKQGSLW